MVVPLADTGSGCFVADADPTTTTDPTSTDTDGDLIFIDDLENPQLRLSATRDNISDNVVVGVRVTGRARAPDITFFSIPEMNS